MRSRRPRDNRGQQSEKNDPARRVTLAMMAADQDGPAELNVN
jgi:hypothetical protein